MAAGAGVRTWGLVPHVIRPNGSGLLSSNMAYLDGIYSRLPVWAQHCAVTGYGAYWHWLRFGPGYRRFVHGYAQRERFSPEDWQSWQQACWLAPLGRLAGGLGARAARGRGDRHMAELRRLVRRAPVGHFQPARRPVPVGCCSMGARALTPASGPELKGGGGSLSKGPSQAGSAMPALEAACVLSAHRGRSAPGCGS